MKVNALIASPKDSIVTLTDKVSVGDQVIYFLNDELVSVTALEDVPQYHRLADELLAYVIRVCEGELTKSEINGSGEILINQQMSYC